MHLQSLELWFLPTAGALVPQVRSALAAESRRQRGGAWCGDDGGREGGFAGMVSEPLRWAITAVEAGRGLRLEGVMLLSPALPAGPVPSEGE